jgi:hypothetical protein
MKYYENLAQNLIQQRNNAKQLFEHTEMRLKAQKASVELQLKRAENGKENTLAFEKAGLARIELELKYANDALNAIIDEIEIQNLAANLKQNEPQSISVVSDNTTEKKFYSDSDFNELVKAILDLDYIRINEFLEFHFLKSFGETITDKMNWLTMLRKHILWLKKSLANPENIDTVPKIGIAEIWEKQKRITVYNDFPNKKNETPPTTNTKMEQEIPIKYIANEHALAYIFDLHANGKQIPINKTEGGYNKKAIVQIGFELYQFDVKKDTFYRAVKHVATFDLNKQIDLLNISKNWIDAVKTLSKDWNLTEKYLKEKKLIGE